MSETIFKVGPENLRPSKPHVSDAEHAHRKAWAKLGDCESCGANAWKQETDSHGVPRLRCGRCDRTRSQPKRFDGWRAPQ
jgi:hypothetical protein